MAGTLVLRTQQKKKRQEKAFLKKINKTKPTNKKNKPPVKKQTHLPKNIKKGDRRLKCLTRELNKVGNNSYFSCLDTL